MPSSRSHIPSQTSNDLVEHQNEIANDNPFQRKKCAKTSKVWLEFTKVMNPNGIKKVKCNNYQEELSMLKSGHTSHLKWHIYSCPKWKLAFKNQTQLKLQLIISYINEEETSFAIIDWRLDMLNIR